MLNLWWFVNNICKEGIESQLDQMAQKNSRLNIGLILEQTYFRRIPDFPIHPSQAIDR